MTGTGPRRRTALACLLFLLCASAACGIPGDDGPRAIEPRADPRHQRGQTRRGGDGRTALADLYFATPGDTIDNLVIVRREVPAGSSTSPTPSTVLENLLLGPQDDDDPVGDVNLENVVTLIPPETQLASPPELDDGILTVDLNSAINGVQGEGARSAYAQLVCTADALAECPGVSSRSRRAGHAPTAGENSSGPDLRVLREQGAGLPAMTSPRSVAPAGRVTSALAPGAARVSAGPHELRDIMSYYLGIDLRTPTRRRRFTTVTSTAPEIVTLANAARRTLRPVPAGRRRLRRGALPPERHAVTEHSGSRAS